MIVRCQLFDADYTMLNGKPLVRLFCKTAAGETVCVFWDKQLPYFYVHAQTEQMITILEALKKRWPELKGEIVEKLLPLGWADKPVKVLKVTGRDPSLVPEQRDLAARLGGMPYEADILFKYRAMVDLGLRGMGWLEVEGKPVKTDTVKCRALEATMIKFVDELGNTPLKWMSIDIETVTSADRAPEASRDPVVLIALTFSPAWHGKDSIVLAARACNGKDIEGCSDESAMLKRFLDILKDYDPDLIVGYNINSYDLPYLLGRLEALNLPRDLGRTDKTVWLKKLTTGSIPSVTGRIIVDPYDILKRDPWMKFKRYDLRTVSKALLGVEKLEMGGAAEIRQLWRGNAEQLNRLIEYSRRDSELALHLVMDRQLLDKFTEIARISGLLLQDAFGGQSQRIECRLLHEFRAQNFIMPCKPDGIELKKRRDERERLGLKGAIVLEPIVGLHINGCTLVLDFTSLYPSVIRTFNVCPTTLVKTKTEGIEVNISPHGAKFVTSSTKTGIIPKLVSELIDTRAAVKRTIKTEADQERIRTLNARQLALKDMTNSVHPETPVVVKKPGGELHVVFIGELFAKLAAEGQPVRKLGEAEVIELPGWETLSAEADCVCFKPLRAVMRHPNQRALLEVECGVGVVSITPDHSIIAVDGKAATRSRESVFTGLHEVRGAELTNKTIIAQAASSRLGNGREQVLNLMDTVAQQPESTDLALFIPRSFGLYRRGWLEIRRRVYSYLQNLNGRADSAKLQTVLNLDRRVLRASEGTGIQQVGLTRVGNCSTVPLYELTEEGVEWLEFAEVMEHAKLTAGWYVIPLNTVYGKKLPRRILERSKIAVAGGAGHGRRKLPVLLPVNEELAELLGWFVAEGSTSCQRGRSFKLGIANYDRTVLERLCLLIERLFGYRAAIRDKYIDMNLKTAYLLFRGLCGSGAYNKRVPNIIFNAPPNVRAKFLEAFTLGDGDADGRRLTTVSRLLAAQLALLLRDQGHLTQTRREGHFWRVRKCKYVRGLRIASGDLLGQPVRTINECPPADYVYDLSVADTEKFISADGIILHNSLYGYTGYIRSRLYIMDVANAITSYGRANILKTRELVETGFPKVKVLYGDTDSVFIKTDVTDPEEAARLGEQISVWVTARLPGLRFSFEKIYKSFLILTKKRYAGWAWEKSSDGWRDKIEMKGIETVRRDWCDLVSETMNRVLETILKQQDVKTATSHVRSVLSNLAAGKAPLEKLTVVKGVTRALESYEGMQPHVELAKKLLARDPTRGSVVGERLGYVIVRGNTLLSKRAEDPAYVREKGLEIDGSYYIDNQVLPPLERIFEALGIGRTELLEGSKQMRLSSLMSGAAAKQTSPEMTVLAGFEKISCSKCSWSCHRPSLSGVCPKCGSQLYFQSGGMLGKIVKFGS